MGISGWLCRECGGREVPLDHFATTKCGEAVHPDYCAALLNDRNGQYVTGAVRVSHGLGCPRRAAIEESESFYVDPLDSNAALTGTAWHSMMEGAGPSSLCEVEVGGVINGVKVNGKIDRLYQAANGDWVVRDHKHIGEFQIKWRKQDGVKLEHTVQGSIYAELCEQSGLPRPVRGIIDYHTSSNGKDALMPASYALLDLSSALDVKPYGGEFTVAELLSQADQFYSAVVDQQRSTDYWKLMPLAGKSIMFGAKTACDYCTVRSICSEAENGSPF